MKKKKILFQSDYSLAKTGFGRNARAILSYLYKTNKYEIVHYCVGMPYSSDILKKTPWKSVGTLPDDEQEQKALERDPNLSKMAAYGAHYLDRIIKEEEPDIYIAAQDIWGVDFAIKKPWFNKIPCVIWTTLDSLPILSSAVEAGKLVENYWVWSNFATKALHEAGHGQVKTVHGALDKNDFFRLSSSKRKKLRAKHRISKDDFVIGFVFRNQLRKSAPNLLEGFKKFLDSNPKAKNAKLLLHTHFSEGWDIPKLTKENGLSPSRVLTTYVCAACHSYSVKSFIGQALNCPFCKESKSVVTSNPALGVTEKELNEVYNLMDVYCHPFTSGGQEFPIQEAKLTELITLITTYSCGEEMNEKDAFSIPLDWTEYREHGTEFIKASTSPDSIAERLEEVFKMDPKERRKRGKRAREWVVKHFSVEAVGDQIEKFIDAQPKSDFDFSTVGKSQSKNPFYSVPEIESDSEWVLCLYHNILNMKEVDEENEGFKYWVEEIEKGARRKDVEAYFRRVAEKENEEGKWKDSADKAFGELLSKEDEGKRLLYVMPESIGDVYLSTSLFKSLSETYPNYNLYIATKPENFPVLHGNPYIHKVIPYIPQMENIYFLEGYENHKGFFEIAFLPFVNTQRQMSYSHNAKDKIAYTDYKYA